ncbi:MAG: NUDIX domain-containing protein [Candidatus Pacebacteria bacterium]|nr:NUDIX domain-containing protein [Candidatus Paceibacterota bacterium]MDD2757191.1 NUDIX domain-containing protein [Candidatus Paceibacterota bacterium]MDD3283768.1 NUDIX domain-containing protein [Candidatus Paceibacterota bacterium]MDD3969923.1 NUDIX domain-containing protein [Candidatus Paceibacterota bacterium]MDD4737820.1 NUDIX domain-containing protein [Candidatus Paceibacterota bacterium]
MELPIKVELFVCDRTEKEPKILLLKRSVEDGGFWQPITGTLEFEESLKDCAIRELKEETGIENIKSISPEIYRFNWEKNGQTIIELVYIVDTEEKSVILSTEHSSFRWVSIEEAKDLLEKENNKKALGYFCSFTNYRGGDLVENH